MATRLKSADISAELRESLAGYAFDTLDLKSVPTGKDPRILNIEEDDFPQAIVQFASSLIIPSGLGGAATSVYGVSVFLTFLYGDDEDPNLLKLNYADELAEWFFDSREGTNYKIMMNDQNQGNPSFDMAPNEETYYLGRGSDRPNMQHVAMLKFEFALTRKTTFSIRSS
jgi:hypothetical protein